MQETLDSLRAFQSRLLLAIHGIPEAELRRPEAEGKWSIADVIAHLGDLELIAAVRIRSILAEDHPPLAVLSQERWVGRVHRGEPVAELLEAFWFHRRFNLGLAERLTDEERQRTGVHHEYGSMTIPQILERLRRHEDKHLGQIERIKDVLGLDNTLTPDVSRVIAGRAGASRDIGPGVRVREMWRNGIKRALQVELDPGAQWPGLDYHVPGPEEVYVVSGDFDDGANVYRAGTFLHHPAGSSHSPRSEEGCVLFVYYPEG